LAWLDSAVISGVRRDRFEARVRLLLAFKRLRLPRVERREGVVAESSSCVPALLRRTRSFKLRIAV
jgi:hypothetical protein